MTLAELLKPIEVLERYGALQGEVVNITEDSRQAKEGSLFVAMKGDHVDGHDYVTQALRQGVTGVAIENPLADILAEGQGNQEAGQGSKWGAIVRVKNSRKALGILADRFFHHPSENLHMVGVTGTNGKTTVTHLCKEVLQAGGKSVGLLGTVGYFIGSEFLPATHTTPGPVELQSLLAKMVASGLDSAVLEVSSHALALDRVGGCTFDTVVYTNLTQDHLDFHQTMEGYFQAKLLLFTERVDTEAKERQKRAVVNVDDAWGHRIIEHCRVPVWSYSIQKPSDIQAKDIRLTMEGTQFTAVTPLGNFNVNSRLVGEHNVYNLLAVIGVGLQAGLSGETILQGIRACQTVPGRFEQVDKGQDFSVIVDYAHTEDALDRLLSAAHTLKTGRIITLFGCGGDRDPGKRSKMGQVAARRSDVVFLTSDNPRSEDPLVIVEEVERGVLEVPQADRAHYRTIPDRAQAIRAAIEEAKTGDMVLIAGKGHEDYQLVGERRLHFDDREMARTAIQELRQSKHS